MTSNGTSYRCEECDMTFSNEKDFMEHKNYAKFRRDGPVGNNYVYLLEKDNYFICYRNLK